MPPSFRLRSLALALLLPLAHAQSDLPPTPVSFDSAADLRPLSANWKHAADVAGDPRRDKTLAVAPGSGVLICNPGRDKETRGHLFTAWEHGDIELDLEFLLPPGSNSGVYLQGRYEVQLFDSWGVRAPTHSDCGGIYQRWDAARGKGNEGYEGVAPRANASRAPGLWQRLSIVFEAPRFDASGKKIRNARFTKVTLNGFVIHENVEVAGPTRSAAFADEKPLGPLMIQGDHGPVALRRLAAKRPESGIAPRPPVVRDNADSGQPKRGARKAASTQPAKAIPVEPKDRVLLQRGFVPFEPRKRLYAASVGSPAGVHFAYDFETGSLLHIWRGSFIDAAPMWEGRGNDQIARPTGPTLAFPGKPTLALIEKAATGGWPDRPEALWSSQGYELEPDGTPVFLGTLSDIAVRDRISPIEGGRGLARTLTLKGRLPSWSTWVLLAEAPTITAQPDGHGWIVGDREWYLDWPADSAHRPVVRTIDGKHQLAIPLSAATLEKPIAYSILW